MEDYKQKYNELVEGFKTILNTNDAKTNGVIPVDDIKKLVPELKEHEREAITKFLINYNNGYCKKPKEETIDTWLKWLDKQKEATCVADIIDRLTEKEQEILFKELEIQKEFNTDRWSEEDNRMLEASILFVKSSLYSHCGDTLSGEISRNDVQEWLKSLKDRVQPQPKQEWSKKDQEMIDSIINDTAQGVVLDDEQIQWIKSLKPQSNKNDFDRGYEVGVSAEKFNQSYNKWKPTKIELAALNDAIRYYEGESFAALEQLYDKLKSL